MERYVAALDIGTQSCKAAIYRVGDRTLHSAAVGYGLSFPQTGWVEQHPDTWVRAAAEAFARALAKVPSAASRIEALCVSGTNGLVMVDDRDEPVYPAVMFSDRRSEKQARALELRYGKTLERVAGNRPAPGSFSLPIINWFRENRPDLWQRVDAILVPAGYVVLRLTGNRTIDTSRASMTLLLDQGRRCWSSELLRAEGIPERVLPRLLEPWEVAGQLQPEAARLLGIRAGVPVLAGCVDTVAACVGLGCIGAGQACLMLGTTGRVVVITDVPRFDGTFINQCHAVPGHWIFTGAMSSSGGSLRWFVDCFGVERAAGGEAKEAGAFGEPAARYQLVDQAAERSPVGSRGVTYLPYLCGERSPLWNSRARGVFFGLSEASTYEDVARSVLEGVAYSFKDNLLALEQATGPVSRLVLGGGGARSRLWRQILADVLERPIEVPRLVEAELTGSIALAGHASGIWGSLEEAVSELHEVGERVEPDAGSFEVYRGRFRLFKKLYEALVPVFDEAAG